MFNEITCKKYLRLAIDFDRSDSCNSFTGRCVFGLLFIEDAVNNSDYVALNFESTIYGVAIYCDDFLIAVLMNPVEYKKSEKYGV